MQKHKFESFLNAFYSKNLQYFEISYKNTRGVNLSLTRKFLFSKTFHF
jgi:hypothetical protein